MNLTDRPVMSTEFEAHLGTYAASISGTSNKSDAKSCTRTAVSEKFCWRARLCDGEIRTTVLIEICHRRPSLFAAESQPAARRGHRLEISSPIAA